jgi:hypothetical protein
VKSVAHYRQWRDLQELRPNVFADLRRKPLAALRAAFEEALREPAVEACSRQVGALLLLGIAESLGRAVAERAAFYVAVSAWRKRHGLPEWCERPAAEACAQWLENGPDFPHVAMLERPKSSRRLSPDAVHAVGETLAFAASEPADDEVLAMYAAAKAEQERRERARFKALPAEERQREGPRRAQKKRHADRSKVHEAWKRRARELWHGDKALTVSAVARAVHAGLGGGAVSTIRGVIAPLKPAE